MVALDANNVRSIVLHFRATKFPTTTGTITKSAVKTSGTENRPNYRADIAYSYTVDGREWSIPRKAFGDFYRLDGRKQAEQLTAAMPEGKELTVYYDPASPGDSVLQSGLQPQHLLFALFVTPFHVLAVALLVGGLSGLVRAARGVRTVPLRPLDDARVAVRVPWISPFWVGLITLGISAFAAMLVVGLTFPIPIKMWAIVLVWVLVLGATAFMALRQKMRLRAGLADLIIDTANRQVTLPITKGRKERVTISWDDIRAVSVRVRTVVTTTFQQGRRSTRRRGIYYLAFIDRNESPTQVAESGNDEELRSIAGTLSSAYGWPLK